MSPALVVIFSLGLQGWCAISETHLVLLIVIIGIKLLLYGVKVLLLEELIVGEVQVSEAEEVGGATGEGGLVKEEGGGEGEAEEGRQQGCVREEGQAMVFKGLGRGGEVLRERRERGKGHKKW